MIPSQENLAKQAIVRVFHTIMTRAGITLIVTVAFSISSMFYNISTDYPFFMVAFLQIVCFAGIYMKLGDLMSMFSLNANDSQSMGRRIFRRPYLYLAHRARRMERRLAGAVTAGGVAGAVAGSTISNRKATRNTATKDSRGNTSSSMGQRVGSKVGAVLDTKNKVKDKASAVKENIKDMPTQTAYAVHSAKEKAKSSVSDFKRGMVQEQQSRQSGRMEKREQHRQNIADKRMELQKAQEARQAQRKADGSATTGATRPHERPATASTIPKPSAEKTQEVKRPVSYTHQMCIRDRYTALLTVYENLEALYICRNVITVYPDCKSMIDVARQKLMNDPTFKHLSEDCQEYYFDFEAYASHLQEHGKFSVPEHGIFELPE